MPASPASTPPPAPSKTDVTPASTQQPEASDAFAGLEDDLIAVDDVKPEPKPSAKVEAPKKKDGEPDAAVKKPEGESDDDLGGDDKPKVEVPKTETPPEDAPDPVKVPELRKAYNDLKKRAKALRSEKEQIETKFKELESKPAPDNKPLLTELETVKKRRDELEKLVEFENFKESNRYKEEFEKPFNNAWFKAVKDFEQLTVKIADGIDEAGQPKFTTRKATADDLKKLANLPLGERDTAITEMFGNSTARATVHIEKVRDLADAKFEAEDNAQKEAGTYAQLRKTEGLKYKEQRIELWKKGNAEYAQKYPRYFAPEEGDAEGNEKLAKGRIMGDKIFAPTPESTPKTVEEMVQLHVQAYNRIVGFPRLALRLKRAIAEKAELQKALDEYEASAPPGGKSGGRVAGKTTPTSEEDLDAALKAVDDGT